MVYLAIRQVIMLLNIVLIHQKHICLLLTLQQQTLVLVLFMMLPIIQFQVQFFQMEMKRVFLQVLF